MASNDSDGRTAVANRIKWYLGHHPNAADTAEGIASWWLGSLSDTVPREVLVIVLERLVEESVLEKRQLPAGITVYSRSDDDRHG